MDVTDPAIVGKGRQFSLVCRSSFWTERRISKEGFLISEKKPFVSNGLILTDRLSFQEIYQAEFIFIRNIVRAVRTQFQSSLQGSFDFDQVILLGIFALVYALFRALVQPQIESQFCTNFCNGSIISSTICQSFCEGNGSKLHASFINILDELVKFLQWLCLRRFAFRLFHFSFIGAIVRVENLLPDRHSLLRDGFIRGT